MKEIGVVEAKNRFSQLLQDVRDGEDFVITRRGEPVALLTRVRSKRKPKLGTLVGRIRFKEGWDAPMGEAEYREFIDNGRILPYRDCS